MKRLSLRWPRSGSLQPQSVDVERLFSTAGNVTLDKRKAILPLTVLKVFKFPYHPDIFRAYRDQIMDCS